MTIRQNRLIPIPCCLLFLIAAALHASEAPSPALHLVVSNEIAPQGGTVQIKVWASPPVSIARGRLFLYLDPAVFGNIASVGVFSAAGDAYGAPTIQGNGLDLSFTSPSASVGRLPDLPIFTVTVPIRSDATPGTTSSILPDASAAPWRDPDGNQYSVQYTLGTVTVGTKLTIANVTPGGGLRPSGTLVRVDGTGFDPGAQLEVEGVSLASVQIVGPEQITFTLAAPAELSAKRVIVRNPDGSQVDYFPSFKPVPADARTAQLLADGQMIFPARLWTSAVAGQRIGGSIAFQNPSSNPVQVSIARFGLVGQGLSTSALNLIVPAEGVITDTVENERTTFYVITASDPLQMIEYAGPDANPGGLGGIAGLNPVAPVESRFGGVLSFYAVQGLPAPSPRTIALPFVPASVSVSTNSGGNWLLVQASGAQLTVLPPPLSLAPGMYTGLITAVPASPSMPAEKIPVIFTVEAIYAGDGFNPLSRSFTAPAGTLPAPQTISINQNGGPAPFSVSVATVNGGRWLSVTPSSGTTPATLTISANTTGLDVGGYLGTITVSGPFDSVTITVQLFVSDAQGAAGALHPEPRQSTSRSATHAPSLSTSSHAPIISVTPASLNFTYGDMIPPPAQLAVTGAVVQASDVQTTGPLAWNTFTDGFVTVYPTAMRPGIYYGSVRISSGGQSVVVPVTITVTAGPVPDPTIGAILNAASGQVSAISPGEIITIHGDLIGPPSPSGTTLDNNGAVASTLAGTRVLFDGHPAPLIYASQSQLNVVVPYEIAGQPFTMVQVEYFGVRSAPVGVPLVPSAPGIFTIRGDGVGQAAVLNEDNSLNSSSNAALRRSVVQIYATGEGLTTPPGITGSISTGPFKTPLLPLSVTIGGLNAPVVFYGSAPDEVSGLLQVNAIVPQDVAPGPAVPITLTVGATASPDRVSIAVQ